MYLRVASIALAAGLALGAQEQAPPANPPSSEKAGDKAQDAQNPDDFVIAPGTKIPLTMINSISTKTASEGERIYLETVFPILANGRVVIPPGSYVAGTITEVKRPGRVKGKGELFVRFDSLTLPNGVTRDFRARMGSLDGTAPGKLDKSEGKVTGEGDKAGDLKTIGEAAGAGAGAGSLGGAGLGHPIKGAGIGAAAGAAAGLMYVLLSRGPDAILAKGTTMEMVLDRQIQFTASEIDFGGSMARPHVSDPAAPAHKKSNNPIRRIPL